MGHALVIGGSMAGLLAARVLSDHFQRVTLIDRDGFPPVGEQRRGVPQGVHAHGLLASGRRTLDVLFPGFSEEMMQAGALSGDVLNQSRWFFEGGCLHRSASGIDGLLASRPFLEGMIRHRVRALKNLEIAEDSTVSGLVSKDGRITGVQTGERAIPADLVVDATGRASKSPEWLDAIGFPRPVEERVEVAIGYTTRIFRRSLDHLDGDRVVVIPPTPEGKRGGVMLAQEGDRWIVTLIGYFGKYAPADLNGFIDFARTLPAPFIHEVISQAEPIGESAGARFPASVRRRYERLDRFPEGLLVTGDAICSFNPIYGQGMSVASLESLALDEALKTGSSNLAREFFRRAAKVVDAPWSIAVGSDLRIPETVGPRNAGVSFVNWYIAKLHRAAHRDSQASIAFLRVANLLAPPPSIMHPRIAMRVLKSAFR